MVSASIVLTSIDTGVTEEELEAVDNRVTEVSGQLAPIKQAVEVTTAGTTISAENKGKMAITGTELALYSGQTKGASLTSEQLDVPVANITETYPRVKVGDSYIGNLAWIARQDGHLSLKTMGGNA